MCLFVCYFFHFFLIWDLNLLHHCLAFLFLLHLKSLLSYLFKINVLIILLSFIMGINMHKVRTSVYFVLLSFLQQLPNLPPSIFFPYLAALLQRLSAFWWFCRFCISWRRPSLKLITSLLSVGKVWLWQAESSSLCCGCAFHARELWWRLRGGLTSWSQFHLYFGEWQKEYEKLAFSPLSSS